MRYLRCGTLKKDTQDRDLGYRYDMYGRTIAGLIVIAAANIAALGQPSIANEAALPSKSGAEISQWMHAVQLSPQSPLYRAQTKLESLQREEPWSSSMEKELRTHFGASATLALFHVECRSLVCEVLLEGRHAVSANRVWWDALFELKSQGWYRTHFRKDAGSTVLFVQTDEKARRPGEVLGLATFWIFLRRDPRIDGLSDKELDEQSLLPKLRSASRSSTPNR
jgi:hypothetical protein